MKSTLFLVLIAAHLVAIASAKLSHADLAARQRLNARSGIDPSSISKECQPQCTTVIKTLDACKQASCECTQANYDALGVCMNCLIALGPPFEGVTSPGEDYTDNFLSSCVGLGFFLNPITISATPTGVSSTGDPLAIFEAPTPTVGEKTAVTAEVTPLMPTPGVNKFVNGSPAGFDAFGAVCASTVFVILGVFLL